MSTDSALKVTQLPAAFSQLGTLHNALVDLIRTMNGAGGIKVVVSDGRIIIDGTGVAAASGYTEGTAFSAVGSDGTLNRVVRHSTWVSPNTSDYPSQLQCGASTGDRSAMWSQGFLTVNSGNTAHFQVTNTDGFDFANGSLSWNVESTRFFLSKSNVETTIGGSGVTVTNALSGDYAQMSPTGGLTFNISGVTGTFSNGSLTLNNGSHSLTVGASNITANMGIKEIDVCSSNTAMKMLIVASDPY